MGTLLQSFEDQATPLVGKLADGSNVTATIADTLQSKGGELAGNLQAKFDQSTSPDAVANREAAGASAAVQLATHGFDPDSAADRQLAVAAVAGGLSLILPIGPVIGAALELLFQVGNAIGALFTKFIFPPVGCVHVGPPSTPSGVLSGWAAIYPKGADPALGGLPPMPKGSFAELAMKTIASLEADAFNCKSLAVTPAHVVSGLAAMWNKHATGPAQDLFVPSLVFAFSTIGGDPTELRWIGSAPVWDNAYTGPFVSKAELRHAFQPIASVPAAVQQATMGLQMLEGVGGVHASVLHLKGSAMAPAPVTLGKVLTMHLGAPAPIKVAALTYSPAAMAAVAAKPAAQPMAAATKTKLALGGVIVTGLAIAAKFL